MSDVLQNCSKAFSQALYQASLSDEKIFIVTNDSVATNHSLEFQSSFPDRLIDVGIAEQNMVGVASGLANSGRTVFVQSAACFLTARALEQIKADVAYANRNVKLCGFNSGLSYAPLGATHLSIDDIAWLRAIPNIKIIIPGDHRESAAAAQYTLKNFGPIYVRLANLTLPDLYDQEVTFDKAVMLRDGNDVTVVSTGIATHAAKEAAVHLEKIGISARILHMPGISPCDDECILKASKEIGPIAVVEEHSVHGGLGTIVCDVTATENPVPVLKLGIPHQFLPIGKSDWLRNHVGLNADSIASRIANWLKDTPQ